MSIRKDKVQLTVEINGKQAGGSLRELQATSRKLKQQLLNATDPKKAAEYAAQLKKVNGKMKDIWSQTRAVSKQTSVWKRTLATLSVAGLVAGALQGIRAMFNLGAESLKLFNIQAKADAQLKAVIKSTNGAARKSYQELKQEASEFQKQSLFGDEQIQKAQSTLLTFTKIQGEEFTKSTQSVLDYSAALGTDLQSASIQVGKALNDPTLGVTALGRAGVQFTKSQKDTIKTLQQTGDVAGAQAIVLKELETQFGGSAKAAAEAGLGPYTQLKNRLDDVKESFGLLIEKGLKVIAPFLEGAVVFFENLVGAVTAGTKATGDYAFAINLIIGAFKNMVSWYQFLYDAGKLVIDSMLSMYEAGKNIPLIGGFFEIVSDSLLFLYNLIANGSAVFAGLKAAAKQSIDNIKSYIGGVILSFKIFAKEAELALSIRSSTRDRLKKEIKALQDFKDEARESGKTIGQAYSDGFDAEVANAKSKIEEPTKSDDTTEKIIKTPSPPPTVGKTKARSLITAPELIGFKEQREEIKANAETIAADRLEQLEKSLDAELDAIEKSFLLGLFTEEEHNRLSLERKLANGEKELLVLAQQGLSETELYKQKELEKLRTQKEIDDQQIEQAKRTADLKTMLQEEGLNSFRSVVDSTIGLLARDEKARKKNAGLIKAFETAKILVNSKVEISEIFKKYAKVPFGTLIAIGQSLAVGLRAATAISSINSQAFYRGGRVLPSFSGELINHASNITPQRGGDSVLATLKPNEVVLNEDQQARAGGADFFRSLGVPGFNTGGLVFTNANTTPTSSIINSIGGGSRNGNSDDVLSQVSAAVSQLSLVISSGIKSSVVYGEIEAAAKELTEIKSLSAL